MLKRNDEEGMSMFFISKSNHVNKRVVYEYYLILLHTFAHPGGPWSNIFSKMIYKINTQK